MKILIFLLLLASEGWSADGTTSRLGGLTVPAIGSYSWGQKINNDIYQISTKAASQVDSNTFASSSTFKAPVLLSGTSIYMTGQGGYITSGSSVNASAFFGNGSALTNIPATVSDTPYNAACDGTTDDSVAIQACVTASASTGIACKLPSNSTCVFGNSVTNNHAALTVAPGAKLEGLGKSTLLFKSDGGGACGLGTNGLIRFTGTSGGSAKRLLENFSLETDVTGTGCMVNVSTASAAQVADVTIDDIDFEDNSGNVGTIGIYVGNTVSLVVANSYFGISMSRDIYDTGSFTNAVYLRDNFFDAMIGVSTHNYMVTLGTSGGGYNAGDISNNVFESGPNGIQVVNGVGVTISNNYFGDIISQPSTGTWINYDGMGGHITANMLNDEGSNDQLTGIQISGQGNVVEGNSIDAALISIRSIGDGHMVKGNSLYYPGYIGVQVSTGSGQEIGYNAEVGNFSGTGRFPYVCDASATNNKIYTAVENENEDNFEDSCLGDNIVENAADHSLQGLDSLDLEESFSVGVNGSTMTVKKASGFVGLGTNDPQYQYHQVTSTTAGTILAEWDAGENGATTGEFKLRLRSSPSAYRIWGSNSHNDGPFDYGTYSDANDYVGMDAAFNWVTGSSIAMTLQGAEGNGWGWLGIGTGNPLAPAHFVSSKPFGGVVHRWDVSTDQATSGAAELRLEFGTISSVGIQLNNANNGDFEYGDYGDLNFVNRYPSQDGRYGNTNICTQGVCPFQVAGGNKAGRVYIGSGTAQSYFNPSGSLFVNSGSSIVLTGSGGFLVGGSSISTTGGMFGNSLTVTGQGTFQSASGVSVIQALATTGTNGVSYRANNTGGNLASGIESSVGGSLVSGGQAYAGVLSIDSAQALQLGTNNTARVTVTSGGNVGIGAAFISPRLLQLRSSGLAMDSRDDPLDSLDYAMVWQSTGGPTGIRPNETGHIIVQPRQSADRDIILRNGGVEKVVVKGASGNVVVQKSSFTAAGDIQISGQIIVQGTGTIKGNAFSVGETTVAVKNGNLGLGYADPLHRLHIVETTQTPGAVLKIPLMINYNGQATNATDVTAGIYSFATENGAVTGTTGHRVGILGRSSDTINSAMPLIGVESRTDAYGSASTYDGGLAYVLGTYPGAVPASIFTGLRVRSQITSDGSTPNAGGTMAGILIEDMVGGGPSTHWSIYQAGADDPSYLAGRLGIGTSSPRGSLDVDGIIYSTEAYVSGKITASSIVLGGGRVARTLYSWYGSSATSASADLQILGTYTLPANTLAANGDSVYVVCWSSTVATSETKQLSPFVDTTNLNASQSTTATGLKTDVTIGRRGASSQWAQSTRVNSGITNVITSLALDETQAHTITCRGAEASAVASGMVLTGMAVEYRPAP